MVEDLTVLLVGDGEPDEKLIEQLEKKNLGVEISSKDEFGSLLALVEPHIVVHTGKDGADQTATILKETEDVRRVRLIVLADRNDLPELRKLDRTVVVSLLATDIAPSVVAARVLMLAKKGPEKSLRPPMPSKKPAGPAADQPVPAAPAPPTIGLKPASTKKPPLPASKAAPKKEAVAPAAKPPVAKKPEVPKATKSMPPRADSLKAKPAKVGPPAATKRPESSDEEEAPISIEEAPISLEEVPASTDGPPSSESPPSEFPTMAFEAPIPEDARPAAHEVRVVLADSDVTRADIIACALRERGIPTRIVPLDAAATHWALVRDFSPTILLGDGSALKGQGAVWLQLFQADQALKKAKLVAVPFERLIQLDQGTVNLRTLIPQIPQLSGEAPSDAKPTTGPVLPEGPPVPAAGAPPAFDDRDETVRIDAPSLSPLAPDDEDDESEFERLTVARPADEPLPEEARSSRGQDLPDPLQELSLTDSVPPSAAQPVTDMLGGAADDAAKTPSPTSSSANKKKSGGGLGLILAAIAVLGAGGAGGWYFLNKKKPASTAPTTAASNEAPPQDKAETAAKDTQEEEESAPPPPSPEELRWKVAPQPAPECTALVTNLQELSVGGIQQATLSLSKARKAMVRGELDMAHKLMCEAVLVHPESLALEELASLLVTKKSPEQALKWHAKALELRPERQRTIELGGDIYNQLGRTDESRDAYVSALRVDGDDQKTLDAVAKKYSEEGAAALKSGSFAKSELLYRRAAILNPKSADAAAGIAATYAGSGNADRSRLWAERTLELDEGHHVALIVMAALATEAGDRAKAEELCKKALERNPTYAPAHQLLHQLSQ